MFGNIKDQAAAINRKKIIALPHRPIKCTGTHSYLHERRHRKHAAFRDSLALFNELENIVFDLLYISLQLQKSYSVSTVLSAGISIQSPKQ